MMDDDDDADGCGGGGGGEGGGAAEQAGLVPGGVSEASPGPDMSLVSCRGRVWVCGGSEGGSGLCQLCFRLGGEGLSILFIA